MKQKLEINYFQIIISNNTYVLSPTNVYNSWDTSSRFVLHDLTKDADLKVFYLV